MAYTRVLKGSIPTYFLKKWVIYEKLGVDRFIQWSHQTFSQRTPTVREAIWGFSGKILLIFKNLEDEVWWHYWAKSMWFYL